MLCIPMTKYLVFKLILLKYAQPNGDRNKLSVMDVAIVTCDCI